MDLVRWKGKPSRFQTGSTKGEQLTEEGDRLSDDSLRQTGYDDLEKAGEIVAH